MKKSKSIGLPKGVRLDRGYIQIRIFHDGEPYCKNFGLDCELARQLACIHLSEKRKEILMGKFGIDKPLERRRFADVAKLFATLWAKAKDPTGKLKHNEHAIRELGYILNGHLIPFFGKMWHDEISTAKVQRWREYRLNQGVQGTTINREQVVLSSIFSNTEKWIEAERIEPFQIPEKNPCKFVERAKIQKRSRVVSQYEASKLLNAARELGDEGGRNNIALALKTALSLSDLKTLKFGSTVNLNRSKTGVPVIIPITVLHVPDWKNWSNRWNKIRTNAGLLDVEFRDLRKAAINWLKGRHQIKLVSLFAGHATQATTEGHYTKQQADEMAILANDLGGIVDAL